MQDLYDPLNLARTGDLEMMIVPNYSLTLFQLSYQGLIIKP